MQKPKRAKAVLLGVKLLAALLCLALLPAGARAQDEPGSEMLAQGEITISCPAGGFGAGGVVRPGEWAGIRLGINDSASRPREIVVRITVPRGDADGDQPMYERAMTTNPGTVQPLWDYVKIPARFSSLGGYLNVTVFAAVEQGGAPAEGERATFGVGKVLGIARLTRPRVALTTDGLMAVVGRRMMGLKDYGGTDSQWLPAGHEKLIPIAGLDADSLPDRWMGLAQYDVMVWNEPSPTQLGTDRAAAIREWVQRGGHLVVVLPRVGQAWTDEANNPLFDIVPRVTVTRREGVDLTPYGALISRSPTTEYSKKEVLQTFAPVAGAAPEEASCVLAGPPDENGKREWLVARRLVGTGRVTFVGLDAASSWMERNNLPDPELFWHRILGRRGELIHGADLNTLQSHMREPVTFDSSIPRLIAKSGQAAAGVLLGFVVFVAYWLVAGPLGFAVLKKSGMARHSWVAFVGAAALFTAIAWGGATAIRPGRTEAKHLTIIDHIYGQNVDRTRSWLSLLVPEYGQATVIVGDPSARERSRFHNAIGPWEPDEAPGEGFPDARGYRIDSKAPDQITIPTRATVKQLQADWAGGPPWKMPRPLSPDPAAVDGAVRIAPKDAPSFLTGTLVHELPADLTDVVILLNRGQRDATRSFAGKGTALWADVPAWRLPASWSPGVPLKLDEQTPRGSGGSGKAGASRLQVEEYLQTILSDGSPDAAGGDEGRGLDPTKRLTGLSFFPMIPPPNVRGDNTNYRMSAIRSAQRKYSHGMDLSAWFTEPCLIIVGHIGADPDQPSPTPLYISTGGTARPLATSGRTIVRWVYPLGSNPPALTSPAATEPTEPPLAPAQPVPESPENP